MSVSEAKQSCALYVRRSHRDAAGSEEEARRGGKSLQQQEKECRALAKREGLQVVRVYSEAEGTGASRYSKAKNRPEWERALADLDDGSEFRTLVVYEVERADRKGWAAMEPLFSKHSESGDRRLIDCQGLDTSQPDQKWNVLIRSEMAAEEVAKLSRRVKRGKQGQRDAGVWLGGRAPYGLRVVDQKLAHDPDTYPVARRISDMALSGMTFAEICKTLNAEGVPAARAKQWSRDSIRSMVLSPAFAGLQTIRGKNHMGNAKTVADVYLNADGEPVPIGEGVITPSERTRLLKIMESRTIEFHGNFGEGRRGSKRSTSLLALVGRCDLCSGVLSITGRSDTERYQCVNYAKKRTCVGTSIRAQVADDAVSALLVERFTDYENESSFLYQIADNWIAADNPEVEAAREDAESELSQAKQALDRVVDAFADGVLSGDDLARQRPRLQKRVDAAQAALDAVAPKQVDYDWFDPEDLVSEWSTADKMRRQQMLTFALSEVRIGPAKARGSKQGAKGRIKMMWLDGTFTAS